MADSTLPGCFALGKPIAPNKCENCKFREDCKRYIPKDALKPLFAKILELQSIVRGGGAQKRIKP